MQVQHNESGESIPTRSLFRKMREVTMRPRNYASFHTTVSDSDSYQGGNRERNEWISSWKSGRKTPVSGQENESERKLREENEALKIRLNAANNAIRDLENACKNHRHQDEGVAPQRFCSLLPKSYRDRQDDVYTCDNRSHYSTAVASQASTVQMGSGAAHKLRLTGRCKNQTVTALDQDDEKIVKDFKHSCSNSLIFGPKLRKKLALREINTSTEYVSDDVTPPCTPERSNGIPVVSNSAKERTIGSLRDSSSGNIGIEHFHQKSLGKRERQRKLLSFSRLVSRPHTSGRKTTDANQYSYDGTYPIDIYPASPIHDDTDDSDVEQLPVVQEMYATQFNICERYEI